MGASANRRMDIISAWTCVVRQCSTYRCDRVLCLLREVLMDINQYQNDACSIAIYPGRNTIHGIVYCALKLNGEAGEIAEKVGKALRDDHSTITPERREALLLELGDVMWYVANLANEL